MSAITAQGTTSKDGRLAYLDGFRALAALAVVVYHCTARQGAVPDAGGSPFDAQPWLESLGRYGVCVFFLLSGLVLYRPFVASALDVTPRPSVPSYAARRILRIYPAYVLALTVWYALGVSPADGPIAPRTYVAEYLLLQNYVPDGFKHALPVAWSLCVEVSFYLVLPLLALGIRRLPGGRSAHAPDRLLAQVAGLVILVVVANGFRWHVLTAVPTWSGSPYVWLPNYLDWFALGMLLATVRTWCDAGHQLPGVFTRFLARPVNAWIPALLLYCCLLQVSSLTMASFAFAGGSAFFLLLPAVLPGRRRALDVLDRPTFLFLGAISYGIFLWHKIVLGWIVEHGPHLSAWQLLAIVLVATIPVAALSYAFLEQPVQKLGRPGEVPRSVPRPLSPSATAS